MKKSDLSLFAFFLSVFCVSGVFSQDMVKPWEKYGLSQNEWKLVQDNKISDAKLKIILSSGIDIAEYCKQPWKKLNIKEGEWLEKRRAGMTSYDIELDIQTDRRGYKKDNQVSMKTASASATSSNAGELFISFILPGAQQQKIGQKGRGTVMSVIAIGSLAGSFIWSVSSPGPFQVIPLFVLIPDMFWSLFDYKETVKKKSSE